MGSSGLWACLNWTVYAERVRDQCNLQWRFGNRAGDVGKPCQRSIEGSWLFREVARLEEAVLDLVC